MKKMSSFRETKYIFFSYYYFDKNKLLINFQLITNEKIYFSISDVLSLMNFSSIFLSLKKRKRGRGRF